MEVGLTESFAALDRISLVLRSANVLIPAVEWRCRCAIDACVPVSTCQTQPLRGAGYIPSNLALRCVVHVCSRFICPNLLSEGCLSFCLIKSLVFH